MLITATLVMQLRERTGAGMMECKKFLTMTDGDIELAIIEMRKAGQATADKKADRIAAEGIIVISTSDDGLSSVMLEINSETDFVARDENFTNFAAGVASSALSSTKDELSLLANEPFLGTDLTVEQMRQELVAKLGENIKLRRMEKIQFNVLPDNKGANQVIGSYLHGSRIGVLVVLKNADVAFAKDIAMHVAASRPLVVNPSQIPAKTINLEREIFTKRAKESGKPDEIVSKMIDGLLNKYLDEVSLLGQPFIKDPLRKVGQLLKEKNAEVLSFTRFEVGEGIEKKADNFVEDVLAQVRG